MMRLPSVFRQTDLLEDHAARLKLHVPSWSLFRPSRRGACEPKPIQDDPGHVGRPHPRNGGRWLLAVVIAGLSLGSTDELEASSRGASGASRPDPCSLVTREEAETALGLKATGPEKNSGFGQFEQCQYLASGERLVDIRSVTVQVHPIDFASVRRAYAEQGEKIEPVEGIGEAAFWAPGQGFLIVQKGKITVGFAVHRSEADLLKASRELATRGLTRIR